MADINNLEQITDKIYQEGIEKAKKDSESIISNAESKAKELLDEAKREAHDIRMQAEREAAKLTSSIENEVRLKGQQLIADLRAEVQQVLSERIVDKGTREALADVHFLQSVIKQVIDCWSPDDDLELILPEDLEGKINDAFYQSVREQARDLTITFSDRLTHGFRIQENKEGYQISFSEEDFNLMFSTYLHRQARDLLFDEKP